MVERPQVRVRQGIARREVREGAGEGALCVLRHFGLSTRRGLTQEARGRKEKEHTHLQTNRRHVPINGEGSHVRLGAVRGEAGDTRPNRWEPAGCDGNCDGWAVVRRAFSGGV
jgi:hypothetical protein